MTCILSPNCPYCDAPEPKCFACDDEGCPECCETEPVTLADLEEIQEAMDIAIADMAARCERESAALRAEIDAEMRR